MQICFGAPAILFGYSLLCVLFFSKDKQPLPFLYIILIVPPCFGQTTPPGDTSIRVNVFYDPILALGTPLQSLPNYSTSQNLFVIRSVLRYLSGIFSSITIVLSSKPLATHKPKGFFFMLKVLPYMYGNIWQQSE